MSAEQVGSGAACRTGSAPGCHDPGTSVALDLLPPGAFALVMEIQAGDADIQRLMAMGVCVGRRVRMIQAGDPLILQVLGARIGVSARMAKRVKVSSCPPPEPSGPQEALAGDSR